MPPRRDQAAIGFWESQERPHGGGSWFESLGTSALTTSRQNLRDEVAMDVDEEDEAGQSTQRPRRVPDFGIEVDFDALGEDERKVRAIHSDAI